jgi:hypothetical protein
MLGGQDDDGEDEAAKQADGDERQPAAVSRFDGWGRGEQSGRWAERRPVIDRARRTDRARPRQASSSEPHQRSQDPNTTLAMGSAAACRFPREARTNVRRMPSTTSGQPGSRSPLRELLRCRNKARWPPNGAEATRNRRSRHQTRASLLLYNAADSGEEAQFTRYPPGPRATCEKGAGKPAAQDG